MTVTVKPPDGEGPWNPGLQSQIPERLLPLATVFREEHVLTSLRDAKDLADLTGLPAEDLVAFRPERLVVHELLARVTADFTVEDGERTEDLGINFRRMAQAILERHILPQMHALNTVWQQAADEVRTAVTDELARADAARDAPPAAHKRSLWQRLTGQRPASVPVIDVDDSGRYSQSQLREWDQIAHSDASALRQYVCASLARVLSSMYARHGRIWGQAELLITVAARIATNAYASERLGEAIEPMINAAADAEGFRRLPVQAHPVVMNTKGASAAGKSTLRPLQRALAARIGVDWRDFALISPDIFRKFLLDYATLGADYKYAGSFTGDELQIVDQKLDRYMARKAAAGQRCHLLIDRFRFDTFAPASDVAGSNLLTRFGSLVYLFFMITPPHSTVERAWHRGLEVGRYKAVDDLLAHNIEAFSGMPEVFFTWALAADKKVHYEFLDNSVALGEKPRTIAFGWNGEMNVLDIDGLLHIERYRKIDVAAREPQAVYPGADEMAPARNTAFLQQCVQRLPAVNFADAATGRIWLRMAQGRLAWFDSARLQGAIADEATRAGIAAIAPGALAGISPEPATDTASPHTLPAAEHTHTLGDWGTGGG